MRISKLLMGPKSLSCLLCFLILLVMLLNIFYLLPQFVRENLPSLPFIRRPKEIVNSNYFLDVKTTITDKWVVNEKNCRIPDISPWDSSIMPLMFQPERGEDCWKSYFHWTYTENMAIMINESDIRVSGYKVENIRCCYHIITREEQDEFEYDKQADNLVLYSAECVEMEKVTRPSKGELFQVLCSKKTFPGKFRTLYTQYHTIPNVNEGSRKSKKCKTEYWSKRWKNETSDIPPNIIFVGLDSTSRNNVHRQMFKTVEALNNIGATEMLGYTKVGANTFPNFVPLFHGYSVEELMKICWKTIHHKLDDCPFIWRRLDAANYYTALMEDQPSLTGFNYLKTGFVRQPVDFYLRPLFLAAHENYDLLGRLHIKNKDRLECIGYKTNDDILVEYINQLLDVSYAKKSPLFSLSWSTTLTHDGVNNCQLLDDLYANLIMSFKNNTLRDNTILIFLSDHGYRFGKFRETLTGWYEDKLPALWIYLPPSIRKRYPQWEKSLVINSRRLTSTYHLHWTINHILDEFTTTKLLPDERSRETGESIPRKFKYSLFNPVPEDWTCEDVGVPETFCACYPLQSVLDSDPNLLLAGENSIETVNSFLPQEDCAVLKVNKIVGGALLDKTALKTNKRITYIVEFTSKPGDFLFEADIDFYPENNTFSSKANIFRTSKMITDVSCVNDLLWEQYCYCKFLLK